MQFGRRMHGWFAIALFAIGTLTAGAVAQRSGIPPGAQRAPVGPAYYPYFNGVRGGFRGGYHSSTAAEGYARGVAEAVRAQGEKNLNDAQAASIGEDARSKYIDNRVRAVQAYYERKKYYNEYREELLYKEAEKRQQRLDRKLMKPLTPDEFDTTTGAIDWPFLLEDDAFSEYTEPLSEIFLQRGASGGITSGDYLEAKRLIKEARAAVTDRKDLYPKNTVEYSLRFLLKLNRELDQNLG
ncbi:MAG: hypothetical protein AAF596_09605 [Planctomycetota bacterium]